MKSPVFEKNYQDYLNQIAKVDIFSRAKRLGAGVDGDELVIPFLGKPYRISAKGITDTGGKRPIYSINIVLFKYLILCPGKNISLNIQESSNWVSYRNFKDASPFVGAFTDNVENGISRNFSGKMDALEHACDLFCGDSPEFPLSHDISMIFHGLPKIPLLLLFNDADEEFPAQCSLLFEKHAENFLDMECLAMLGWIFADTLANACHIRLEKSLQF